MLMRMKDLDPAKYYHCVSNNEYKNTWLSKGASGKIFLQNSLSAGRPTVPYIGENIRVDRPGLDSGIEWDVREATEEETEWILQCIAANKLVPRPQENYQIF